MADDDRYIMHILVLSVIFMSVAALYFYNYSGLVSSTQSTRTTATIDPGIMVLRDTFNGATTVFVTKSDAELENITNMTFEVASYGRMDFLETVNITGDAVNNIVDVDGHASIRQSCVSVNTTRLQSFKKSVRISLINLGLTDPRPLLNNASCSLCTEISYTGGNFTFQATFNAGASVVEFCAGETPAAEVPAPTPSAGGGVGVEVAPLKKVPPKKVPPLEVVPPPHAPPPIDVNLGRYPACTVIPISAKNHSNLVRLISAVLEPDVPKENSRLFFQDFPDPDEVYDESGFTVGKGEITILVFDLKGKQAVGSIEVEIEVPRKLIRSYGVHPDTLTLMHRFSRGEWKSGGGILKRIGANATSLLYRARIDKSAFNASLFALSGGPRPLICQLCESSEWSECKNSGETRLYNECGEHTGFSCRPMPQTRACGVTTVVAAPPPLEPIIFSVVAIIVSLAFLIRATLRRRERQQPIYVMAAAAFIALSAIFTFAAYSSLAAVQLTGESIRGVVLPGYDAQADAFLHLEPIPNIETSYDIEQAPLLVSARTRLPEIELLPSGLYRITARGEITSLCGTGRTIAYFIHSTGGGMLVNQTTEQNVTVPVNASAELPLAEPGDAVSYAIVAIDRSGIPVYGGRVDIVLPGLPDLVDIDVKLLSPGQPAGAFYETVNISTGLPVPAKAGDYLDAQIVITNKGTTKPLELELEYGIADLTNSTIAFVREPITLEDKIELRRRIRIPPETREGFYNFYGIVFNLFGRQMAKDADRFFVYTVLEAAPPEILHVVVIILILYTALLLILLLAYWRRRTCYICGKKARYKCIGCNRYICAKHSVERGKKQHYCMRPYDCTRHAARFRIRFRRTRFRTRRKR